MVRKLPKTDQLDILVILMQRLNLNTNTCQGNFSLKNEFKRLTVLELRFKQNLYVTT